MLRNRCFILYDGYYNYIYLEALERIGKTMYIQLTAAFLC